MSFKYVVPQPNVVVVAERSRRWTRNPLGSPRTGSNPVDNGQLFCGSPVVDLRRRHGDHLRRCQEKEPGLCL